MGLFKLPSQRLNIEIGDTRIEDVAEKIGTLFGEEARELGKVIDDATKNITIKIEHKSSNKN